LFTFFPNPVTFGPGPYPVLVEQLGQNLSSNQQDISGLVAGRLAIVSARQPKKKLAVPNQRNT
jgi:hypothetical protein